MRLPAPRRVLPAFLCLALCGLLAGTPAPAHADDLVVGIKPAPPFVVPGEDGSARGFSVDLVREIAARLDPPRTVRFEMAPDLATHLADVAAGKVQMGIAATNVTADREALVDFSNPFFRDSLDIVVRPQEDSSSLWDALLDSDVPSVLLGLLLFVLITAHIVWFAERKGGGFDPRYGPGIGQGIWWTIVTMSTVGYGDFVPKTSGGRALGVVVIFSGIVMFGAAVASLTAAATAQRLGSSIEGISDVAKLRVVALPNSVASQELARRGIRMRAVASTAAGLEAVRRAEADAFVHDRSQLLYALSQDGQDLVLVGRPFVQQNYAMAFPLGSPLRKQMNIAFNRLQESDDAVYEDIYQRWFPQR
jgi:polar amino acid transport system substrate-binding protein